MAKVSVHGKIIGDVELFKKTYRYMSDGTVLKNSGHGWKLHGKARPDQDIVAIYQRHADKVKASDDANPFRADYRKKLHDLAGLCKRWMLHTAVVMMPDDPDGVWSEACDGYGDNIHADIDEIAELCRAYKLYADYAKQLKSAASTQSVNA